MITLLLVVAASAPPSPHPEHRPPHRAIVVSYDALNRERAMTTVAPSAIPHFTSLFATAACAEGSRPAFPSLTAVSHASLWTGAYADVTGIGDNSNIQLPLAAHSLIDLKTGFDASQLRAEPLWIAAARQGITVVGHQVTQAPGAPGRLQLHGESADSLHRRDLMALQRPGVMIVNGYNARTMDAHLLTDSTDTLHDAPAWRGVPARRRGDVTPRELEWDAGPVHLFALFTGGRTFDRVIVSPVRDARRGVVLRPMAEDRAPIGTRPLARRFAPALVVPVAQELVHVNLRLFDLAPDASRFMLFQAEGGRTDASNAPAGRAYEAAIGGWVGGAPTELYRKGGFGPTLMQGGRGQAEYRYLEAVELIARQAMRGSAWLRRRFRPQLQMEYLPVIDEIDHLWLGWTSRGTSLTDSIAARVQAMRERGWSIADRHLGQLQQAAAQAGTMLVVVSDHGMRPYHRLFRVNAALRDAGLLAVDGAGKIDIAHSRAVSAAGHFVTVNRVGRPDGIVADSDVPSVITAIEAALRAARSPEGTPIVTALYEPATGDSLGLGGPNGGDVYFGLAEGYAFSTTATGNVTDEHGIGAGHGYPSIEPDMQATFCAAGGGVMTQRLPVVRTIDMAPTVASWLGIDPPADAVGQSLLGRLLRQP